MRKMKSNSIFFVKEQQKKSKLPVSRKSAQALEVAEQPTHTLMDG